MSVTPLPWTSRPVVRSPEPATEIPTTEIVYPDSDGKPMADSTQQFRWIVAIEQNIELLTADDPNIFVAGDLLWYPRQGRPDVAAAPDTMVVFGRPKGDRRSYLQWNEDNIGPQVVFEVLSHSNTAKEMAKKLLFYDRHGVEEYYVYDPQTNTLEGWLRDGEQGLVELASMDGWVSPRLGIRFDVSSGEELQLFRPDGQKFFSFGELEERFNVERDRAEAEAQRAEAEAQRAEAEAQRAEAEAQRAAELAALVDRYRQQFGDLPTP